VEYCKHYIDAAIAIVAVATVLLFGVPCQSRQVSHNWTSTKQVKKESRPSRQQDMTGSTQGHQLSEVERQQQNESRTEPEIIAIAAHAIPIAIATDFFFDLRVES